MELANLVIARLSVQGYNGFEELPGILKAYIPFENFDELELKETLQNFEIYDFEKINISEVNWNAQWESSFEPVIINNFAGIRASFHKELSGVHHELIITPKMSFGTGHHATTWLMISMMQDLDFTNKTVLDFGTGTGVLAILAEKLGALNVLAIDNDKWSIENAHENLIANHCVKINVFEAEEIDENYRADIILANINLNVLQENLSALKYCCGRNATILFSGLLNSDKEFFLTLLEQHGFTIVKAVEKIGWCAFHVIYNEMNSSIPL